MSEILIVEDDLSIANLLSDHLKRAGHDARIETNGDEALDSYPVTALI